MLGTAAARAVGAQQAADQDQDVLFYSSGTPIDFEKQRDSWLKAVADKLGVTPERVDKAMQDASKDIGLPSVLLAPLPMPPVPPIGAGTAGAFSIHIDDGRAVAAKTIGISEDQLRTELKPGKSIADVARARGVEPQVVADAMKAQRRADLDKAVADGKLPARIADQLKSHIDREIDQLIQLPGDRQFAIRLEHGVSIREP